MHEGIESRVPRGVPRTENSNRTGIFCKLNSQNTRRFSRVTRLVFVAALGILVTQVSHAFSYFN